MKQEGLEGSIEFKNKIAELLRAEADICEKKQINMDKALNVTN